MANKTASKLRHERRNHPPGKGARNAAAADMPASERIVERPDGYYWLATKGLLEFGPYESYELALSASEATSEEALAPVETLHNAERGMGLADWIDPQTGTLPEDGSPPHIEED